MTQQHRSRLMLATLFAVAAAVPVTIGLAQAAPPVGSRDAAAIERDYGRAGGDPYWTNREEQPVPAPIEQAYDRTKDWLSQPGASAPQQPERYGRGGGYVGLEKFDRWTGLRGTASPQWGMARPALQATQAAEFSPQARSGAEIQRMTNGFPVAAPLLIHTLLS